MEANDEGTFRWFRVVVYMEASMEVEEKEYPYQARSETYQRMRMLYHQLLYGRLHSTAITDAGKHRARACFLSRQVKYLKGLVDEYHNDVVVPNNGYEGKRNSHYVG